MPKRKQNSQGMTSADFVMPDAKTTAVNPPDDSLSTPVIGSENLPPTPVSADKGIPHTPASVGIGLSQTPFRFRFDYTHTKTSALPLGKSPGTRNALSVLYDANIESYRPAAFWGTPLAGSGAPAYVYTPHGTRLDLSCKYDDLAIYQVSDADFDPKLFLDKLSAEDTDRLTIFWSWLSECHQAAASREGPAVYAIDSRKTMDVEVTLARLQAVKAEHEKAKGQRYPSQRDVMGQGVNSYKDDLLSETYAEKLLAEWQLEEDGNTEILDCLKNLKPEWLHLAAYSMLGKEGQIPDNLVFGSKECNTQMLVIESLVLWWARKHPQEQLKIKVVADMVGDSHASKKISYNVTFPDGRKFSYEFFPFSQKKPFADERKYVGLTHFGLYESQLNDVRKKILFDDADSTPSPSPTSSPKKSI